MLSDEGHALTFRKALLRLQIAALHSSLCQRVLFTQQLRHPAGDVEVQPLSPSLTLPLNSNPEQTYSVY